MRRILVFGLFLAMLVSETLDCQANSPLPPLPLSKRVGMSTHVFVGTVKQIDYVDKDGQVITPEQAYPTFPNLTLRLNLQVDEILFPAKWKAGGTVQLRDFISLWRPYEHTSKQEGVKDLENVLAAWRKSYGEKKYVFVTRVVAPKRRSPYLVSVQGPYYREDLEKKSSIKAIIRKAVGQKRKRP